MSNSNGTPPSAGKRQGAGGGQGSQHLYVENLNYSGNDIAEIRRLAKDHPDLAEKVIDNAEAASVREDRSFLIGLIVTAILVVLVVGIGAWTIVKLGWWQSILFVAMIIAASHVVVAVLKGKFSETSWFGRFLKPKQSDD